MHLARAQSSPFLNRERALWGQQPDGEGLLKEIGLMVEVNLMNEVGLVVQLKERACSVRWMVNPRSSSIENSVGRLMVLWWM